MSRESNFLSFGSGGDRFGFLLTDSEDPYPLTTRVPAGKQPFGISQMGRMLSRGFWVSIWLLRAALEFLLFIGTDAGRSEAGRRAWQKRTAQGLLRSMEVEVKMEGVPPTTGLLVSNHLSYLDILVLASVAPCIFVSKQEVRGWPVFGWLARCAGTIFVNRQSRSDVARVSQEITQTLHCGAVVTLFPEGTSSNGSSVLPFRSSLLEPILQQNQPVTPAALDYSLAAGSVEEEVCYWGDMTLGPHLLNLLTKEGIQATIRFGRPELRFATDRKQLARELHEKVCLLRANSLGSGIVPNRLAQSPLQRPSTLIKS